MSGITGRWLHPCGWPWVLIWNAGSRAPPETWQRISLPRQSRALPHSPQCSVDHVLQNLWRQCIQDFTYWEEQLAILKTYCKKIFKKQYDYVDHNKLWKILKEMGVPDHLTCLLRNLYGGQEAKVRIGHGTTDWFQIGKGVHHGCISSPCLFNLYAEYIMRNAGLEEAQAGIKIARRNISNLRYADDTMLTEESEEELKSHLMKVK